MYYKVIKLGWDGISVSESRYNSIDDVCRDMSYSKGWDGLEQAHRAIRKWSESAWPWSVYCLQHTVIIVVGESPTTDDACCPECGHDNLDYGGIDIVENGNIEQEIWCHRCGERWKDIFVFVERRTLASSE